ncbi:MAG: DUF1573 domain-containing protein [Pirellulaceae bacterium]|nr:DUF1573 domain-containing protein [Pirellulaceae bacterium]
MFAFHYAVYRTLSLAISATFISVCICINGFCDDAERPQIIDFPLFGVRETELIPLDLVGVTPGMLKKATVFIKNHCDTPLEFLEVETGCKCTVAKVPKMVLPPDDTAQLDFEFSVPSVPNSLKESYDVTLRTKGARSTIRIRFEAKLEKTIVFGMTEFSHSFNRKIPIVSCLIPFQVSELGLLDGIRVTRSDELSFMKVNIEREKNQQFVRCKFFANSMLDEVVVGEVRLEKDAKTIATILCSLRKQSDAEFLPNPMGLIPVESSPVAREGFGILRLRTTENNAHRTIRSIEVSTNSNSKHSVTFTRITDEIYRIKIFVNDVTTADLDSGLTLVLKTSDGIESKLKVKCILSN